MLFNRGGSGTDWDVSDIDYALKCMVSFIYLIPSIYSILLREFLSKPKVFVESVGELMLPLLGRGNDPFAKGLSECSMDIIPKQACSFP